MTKRKVSKTKGPEEINEELFEVLGEILDKLFLEDAPKLLHILEVVIDTYYSVPATCRYPEIVAQILFAKASEIGSRTILGKKYVKVGELARTLYAKGGFRK